MTVRRVALAASTGLALAPTLVAAPASAQEQAPELPPLTITPTSGPGGTVITASGADCARQQAFNAFIQVYFADEDEILNAAEGAISDNGTWSQPIQVPGDADPAATYMVFATCFVDSGQGTDPVAEYEDAPFVVSGAVVAPGQQAAPASPVPGDPTFTG